MNKAIKIILISIIITGCYTVQTIPISKIMDENLGMTEQDIRIKFGPPSSVSTDGAGGKILIYTDQRTLSVLVPVGNADYLATKNLDRYINFYINKGDSVYYWRTNYPDIRTRVKKNKNIDKNGWPKAN